MNKVTHVSIYNCQLCGSSLSNLGKKWIEDENMMTFIQGNLWQYVALSRKAYETNMDWMAKSTTLADTAIHLIRLQPSYYSKQYVRDV